jgi:GH15 family glucan-1,4-alpha-glucosidase
MCWAACDRLAKIAATLARTDRVAHWTARAAAVKAKILERAWSASRQALSPALTAATWMRVSC